MTPPLGFLEPLSKLLSHHGDNLQDKLSHIVGSLSTIASNTEAQLLRNIRARKTVSVPGAEGEEPGEAVIRNDSAYGWRVVWASGENGNVSVGIGVQAPEGFLINMAERPQGYLVDWYVPVNGVLFISNSSEEPSSLNLEVEVLVSEAVQASTGDSGEQIDITRREPIPSGSPLDTPSLT